MKRNLFFVFALIVMVVLASCKKDDDGNMGSCNSTYDSDVKAIIDATCAYSGCHSGSDAGMFIPDYAKDFTTYAGMTGVLIDSLTFATRALEDKDMPPAAFVVDPNPTELTAAQLTILNCWKDEGYPEN